MKKLSKSNIYAIQYLLSQGKSVEEIASEINLTTDSVQATIDSEKLVVNNSVQTKTPKDLMISQTSVKKTNSVSIMTKEASMMNDHNRSKHKTANTNDANIFKPLNK